MEWNDSDENIEFYTMLYSYGVMDEAIDEKFRNHARHLLYREMIQREAAGNYEGIAPLLRLLPEQTIQEAPEMAREYY